MRWKGERESEHVEDRRGQPKTSGMSLVSGKGKFILLIVVLFAGYYGIDLTPLLKGDESSSPTASYEISSTNNEAAQFTAVILASTEAAWGTIFNRMGQHYQEPTLVLYTESTNTGCGIGQAIMGPFYCSVDRTVYLDLSFYQDMKQRLGGGGEFAQAYVISHEVGHHVQNLLGTLAKVRQLQQGQSEKSVNQLSVMLELQADCYAGVWGNTLQDKNMLVRGDLETALLTAQAIGDDRLQKKQTGKIVPDSFTHGTSQQRYDWFLRGFQSGDISQCNTFGDLL